MTGQYAFTTITSACYTKSACDAAEKVAKDGFAEGFTAVFRDLAAFASECKAPAPELSSALSSGTPCLFAAILAIAAATIGI